MEDMEVKVSGVQEALYTAQSIGDLGMTVVTLFIVFIL